MFWNLFDGVFLSSLSMNSKIDLWERSISDPTTDVIDLVKVLDKNKSSQDLLPTLNYILTTCEFENLSAMDETDPRFAIYSQPSTFCVG